MRQRLMKSSQNFRNLSRKIDDIKNKSIYNSKYSQAELRLKSAGNSQSILPVKPTLDSIRQSN